MPDDYGNLRQRLAALSAHERHHRHHHHHHHPNSGDGPDESLPPMQNDPSWWPKETDDAFAPDNNEELRKHLAAIGAAQPASSPTEIHHHTTNNTYTTNSKQADIGTVQHAIDVIVAAVQALPYMKQRHKALGVAIGSLIQRNMLSGIAAVNADAMASINHYSVEIE
jgi:hypothetical protein